MSMRCGLVPTIVASSPYAAQQFLKNHDLVFASRTYSKVSQYIFYDQRNIMSSKYGPYWQNMLNCALYNCLAMPRFIHFSL